MAYTITPFVDHYIEDAARIVSSRCQALQEQVGCLPLQYTQPDHLMPIIQHIASENPGVAALRKGHLVGFMTAWRLASFHGKPAVFSPELANAAQMEDSQRIYEEMYTHLSAIWAADGYHTHLVSLLANDNAGLYGWSCLGFGMIAADGLRTLESIPGLPTGDRIHRAGMADAEVVLQLGQALDRYLESAPTFLKHETPHTTETVNGWLSDPGNAFWIAWDGGRPLAYICFGPASQDASLVIVDEKTTSIRAAYTIESARRQGIAAALLNRGLSWAREQGYKRCAVDFEPMNPLARRFWLRHFQPVSYSVCRQLF